MIDYHYCSKICLIIQRTTKRNCRIAQEKRIFQALIAERLKKYSKLNVSFNIFNFTNYNKDELIKVCKLYLDIN